MKNLSKILIVLTITAGFLGCKKDKNAEDTGTGTTLPGMYKAKYEVKVDGKTVKSGTASNASVTVEDGVYGIAILGESNSDYAGFSMSIAGYPEETGKTAEIDYNVIGVGIFQVDVNGEKKNLNAMSGTVKRESETKVSFTGKTKDDEYTISGYIESEAYKHPIQEED